MNIWLLHLLRACFRSEKNNIENKHKHMTTQREEMFSNPIFYTLCMIVMRWSDLVALQCVTFFIHMWPLLFFFPCVGPCIILQRNCIINSSLESFTACDIDHGIRGPIACSSTFQYHQGDLRRFLLLKCCITLQHLLSGEIQIQAITNCIKAHSKY